MMAPAASCTMPLKTFGSELTGNALKIIEKSISRALLDFSSLMYAVAEASF